MREVASCAHTLVADSGSIIDVFNLRDIMVDIRSPSHDNGSAVQIFFEHVLKVNIFRLYLPRDVSLELLSKAVTQLLLKTLSRRHAKLNLRLLFLETLRRGLSGASYLSRGTCTP
jgi:hypothetical protein